MPSPEASPATLLSRLRRDFDEAAERYDHHAGLQQRSAEALARRTASTLAPSDLILDVGAGTGALARHLPGHRLVQLDLAFAMCRAAARHGPAICADGMRLPFADRRFDAVISNLCLQWLPLGPSLAEWRRVTRPGGRLVLTLLGEGSLPELASAYREAGIAPRLLSFASPAQIETAAADAGLVIGALDIARHTIGHPSVEAFLRHFRQIGAGYKGDARVLGAGAIRRLVAAYPRIDGEALATYRVVTVEATRG